MNLKTHTIEYLELKKEFENFEITNEFISIDKMMRLGKLGHYIVDIGGSIRC